MFKFDYGTTANQVLHELEVNRKIIRKWQSSTKKKAEMKGKLSLQTTRRVTSTSLKPDPVSLTTAASLILMAQEMRARIADIQTDRHFQLYILEGCIIFFFQKQGQM